jgi:hypothetical protein
MGALDATSLQSTPRKMGEVALYCFSYLKTDVDHDITGIQNGTEAQEGRGCKGVGVPSGGFF